MPSSDVLVSKLLAKMHGGLKLTFAGVPALPSCWGAVANQSLRVGYIDRLLTFKQTCLCPPDPGATISPSNIDLD